MPSRFSLFAIAALLVALLWVTADAPAGKPVDPLASLPLAGREFATKTMDEFFGRLQREGAEAATESIAGKAPFDPKPLVEPLQTLLDKPGFRAPDGYGVVSAHPYGVDGRYFEVRAFSYHLDSPVAWRFRFYRRADGTWLLNAVEFQNTWIDAYTNTTELEFEALQRTATGAVR